jgi:hypothetical protein
VYKAELASENDLVKWDEIIRSCPYSCAFHTSTWREALEKSFRQLRSHYFFIKDGSTVVAALPVFTFSPIPLVRFASSMPWNLFGGALIIRECDIVGVVKACSEALSDLAQRFGVCESAITLSPHHDETFGKALLYLGYTRTDWRFTHLLKTKVDYEELWKAYNKRVRTAVRKAEKLGVKVRESQAESDLREFYTIYLNSMERLEGTPKPFSLLRELQLSEIAKLSLAEYDGKIIAGLLYLFFNRTLTLWVGASSLEYREVRPNNAIFHQVIKWACEVGYDYVDFGASPPGNEGLVAFKEEWRAKPFHFESYVKRHSKWKKQIWTMLEPMLRRLYGIYQKKSSL